ncbi:MAG: TolC family protein [Gemmatimonadaceae bacterium]
MNKAPGSISICTRRVTAALLFLSTFLVRSLSAQAAAHSAGTALRGATDTTHLTINDARAAAVRANPELAAARTDIDVARGVLRQAGILRFNPSADLLGSAAGGIGAEIGLSQEIEVGGQRGARRAVARAGVSRATFSVADAARVTLFDVDRTFYRAVASDRRAALASEVLALNERLAQAATRQLREGEISKLDYNLSVVELGRSRARALAARREQQQSQIELRRVVGLPFTTPTVAVFDSTVHRHLVVDSSGSNPHVDFSAFGADGDTTVDALVSRALARRPDLGERESAVTQANADVTLARREALPNLFARVLSQTNDAGNGRVLRPGIGLSLPLFNRNQGEIEARRAVARRTTLERAALVTRVGAEVESAFRGYLAAAGEVEVLERTVLGPARDNRRLLEAAYREGKVGLPVLLLIRNQVIDAEQEYWTAWLAERVAAADLTAAVATSAPTETRARP